MTLVYYQRSTALATDTLHSMDPRMYALEPTTAASLAGGQLNLTTDASGSVNVWTTQAGVPNIAAWGSGTYRAQLNATTIGANMEYGFRLAGASGVGHFARVDSALANHLETVEQAEALFTGTGLKLATVSWTPTAGSASDRYEIIVGAWNNAGSMAQGTRFTLNTVDSYTNGPFDVVASKAPPPRPTSIAHFIGR